MNFPEASIELARRVLGACERRGWHLATAESCTGGLIIGCLTEIPGSSSVVVRGSRKWYAKAWAVLLALALLVVLWVGLAFHLIAFDVNY